MGWKGSKDITKEEALLLIQIHLIKATNDQLEQLLNKIGFGDDSELPHFGYNLYIKEESEDEFGYR